MLFSALGFALISELLGCFVVRFGLLIGIEVFFIILHRVLALPQRGSIFNKGFPNETFVSFQCLNGRICQRLKVKEFSHQTPILVIKIREKLLGSVFCDLSEDGYESQRISHLVE